jgi:polar amino acid transport system substrate-binding protein
MIRILIDARDSIMIRKFFGRSGKGWRNMIFAMLLILGFSTGSLLMPQATIAQSPIAQSPPPVTPTSGELRVATRLLPPFAMENNGSYTGFSMELWQKIAAELGKTSKIVVYPTLPEVLSAVQDKKVDAAIAAISITAEREQKLDFSYPMFNAGLQILVRTPQKSGFVPNLLRDLFSPVFLQLFGIALAMVVVAAHVVWLLERNHPKSAIAPSYFPGIFEAAWWAAATLATQAEEMPKGAMGRIMAVFWMFIAVVFVAYFTATVTTSMTVQTLQGDIKSLDDLQNRTVATTAGSTAAEFLQEKHIKTLALDKIESAYDALLNNQADAVIFDAPVLMYYASHEGKGNVQLVGDMLREESYGIAVPNNSPYRKPINSALLKLRENGTYQALYDEWFKPKSDS